MKAGSLLDQIGIDRGHSGAGTATGSSGIVAGSIKRVAPTTIAVNVFVGVVVAAVDGCFLSFPHLAPLSLLLLPLLLVVLLLLLLLLLFLFPLPFSASSSVQAQGSRPPGSSSSTGSQRRQAQAAIMDFLSEFQYWSLSDEVLGAGCSAHPPPDAVVPASGPVDPEG